MALAVIGHGDRITSTREVYTCQIYAAAIGGPRLLAGAAPG
jgi:hypothetical protein